MLGATRAGVTRMTALAAWTRGFRPFAGIAGGQGRVGELSTSPAAAKSWGICGVVGSGRFGKVLQMRLVLSNRRNGRGHARRASTFALKRGCMAAGVDLRPADTVAAADSWFNAMSYAQSVCRLDVVSLLSAVGCVTPPSAPMRRRPIARFSIRVASDEQQFSTLSGQ